MKGHDWLLVLAAALFALGVILIARGEPPRRRFRGNAQVLDRRGSLKRYQ